ncbi:MAG: transposase [Opitutae bacterium]|nr:transposase [Opitutae bacterium]
MAEQKHLRRLGRIWIPSAVYFITVCTHGRKPVLASPIAAGILLREWQAAKDRHGWLVGRYVVMPDHVHFFCAEQAKGEKRTLSQFMNKWKEWTAKGLITPATISAPVWQRGFVDHLMRSDESYGEKWSYVRENPVRAGLASSWEAWPWQGFVDFNFPGADQKAGQSPRPAGAATTSPSMLQNTAPRPSLIFGD